MKHLRIGIDTGGTFTDFVIIHDSRVEVFKELSTPSSPEKAILKGLKSLKEASFSEIIHGSTVATNTLLERKGAQTALLATAGFEDVLVIGRQPRRDLYDILVTRPEPLISAHLRLGVNERTLFEGSIHRKLNSAELTKIVKKLRSEKVESIAVSLLYSFANPSHEKKIGEVLSSLGIPISLSSEILPEYREYERTSTTAINAYLAPVMSQYLEKLETGVSGTPLRVMQSNGGVADAKMSMVAPVKTILSGPAGGVVGAFYVSRESGYSKIITFDMGGTSTDVALCDGEISVTNESQLDGMPIGVPMMGIHTVGAGGGSIAELDAGGALRVGPESAGAEPGPICYGKGDSLTVTDANVLLGRLLPRFFLGGSIPLAVERIPEVVDRLDWTSVWSNRRRLAQGIIDVVNNNMEQAIRLISIERGHDVRDFTLVCFGGAGALHAATLAGSLGIPRVLVPPHPGALSALGLLLADSRKDYSRTLLGASRLTDSKIRKALSELHRKGVDELRLEGFKRNQIKTMDFLDVRYRGQSYELTIPFSKDWSENFHHVHDRRYGYSNPQSPVEVVSARTTLLGETLKPGLTKASRKAARRPKPVDNVRVWFGKSWSQAQVFDRAMLRYGHVVSGPAIVGEYSSTTLIPPDHMCEVDKFRNLVLTKKRRD